MRNKPTKVSASDRQVIDLLKCFINPIFSVPPFGVWPVLIAMAELIEEDAAKLEGHVYEDGRPTDDDVAQKMVMAQHLYDASASPLLANGPEVPYAPAS